MQPVSEALDQVKALYEKVLGKPAPEIASGSFVPFPPGVDPLDHAVREVDQLRQWSDQLAMAPRPAAWSPPTDSFRTPDAYLFRVEVPGVERETLRVFLVGDECVVRGERAFPAAGADLQPLNVERPWGPFERRFTLPRDGRTNRVTASCANGVLEVRVGVETTEVPKETKVDVA